MARYLRDPQGHPAPAGIEARRLQIYEDLIYNNIEGFISSGFPVLHSLYTEDDWRRLVRSFMDGHRCRTPYFLEISQEFVRFLMERYNPVPGDPPFLSELAHYEWVELALSVAEGDLPQAVDTENLSSAIPVLSPLAWSLAYRFPVHLIGPGFQPEEAGDAVYLAVYRDREDDVRFMELNAATSRLLEKVRDNRRETAHGLLSALAPELGMSEQALIPFGLEQLQQFVDASVVLITDSPDKAVVSI